VVLVFTLPDDKRVLQELLEKRNQARMIGRGINRLNATVVIVFAFDEVTDGKPGCMRLAVRMRDSVALKVFPLPMHAHRAITGGLTDRNHIAFVGRRNGLLAGETRGIERTHRWSLEEVRATQGENEGLTTAGMPIYRRPLSDSMLPGQSF
jgi:hypothetical protein